MEGTYTSRKVPNMKITNSNLNCTFHCGCNAIWWPRDSAQRFVLCASKVTAWVRSPSRVCFVSAMSGVFYSCMRSPPPGFQAYEGLHADWPRKVYSHPATAHRGANVPFRPTLPLQRPAKYQEKENCTCMQNYSALCIRHAERLHVSACFQQLVSNMHNIFGNTSLNSLSRVFK